MNASEGPPNIQVLPETVSSQIAAGEVVDRPASIVKELVDNSLDAGSSYIAVDILGGGTQSIRVTDNGKGMSRAEAQLACQRFATSKLRTEADLFRIETFGFRGEALPSIASVSRMSLLTTRPVDSVGTFLRVEGGTQSEPEERVSALGTQIQVANLFYNTPGRLKFLKSAVTEFSHICHVVHQAALASPETHFRLTHNEREILDYPAVATFLDRATQVYGVKLMNDMMPVDVLQGGVRLHGIIVNPYCARTTRSPQDVFVNRRPVKNSTISHAVYEAYASYLPKGRHPLFALLVTVDPNEVDVNVHPSKREVKFSKPDWVHRLVKESVRRPLHRKGTVLEQNSGQHPIPSITTENHEGENGGFPEGRPFQRENPEGLISSSDVVPGGGAPPLEFSPASRSGVQESMPDYSLSLGQSVQVFGQISFTYILAQVGDVFHVLDQHTIHERVLFERLWRGWKEQALPSQPLLIPEPVELSGPKALMVEEYQSELLKLGLAIESFGVGTVVIRAIPAMLGPVDYAALLQDIVDDLSEWKSLDSLEHRIRPVLASMACQGAVQAGRAMNGQEMKQVVEDWITEGFPMTCPHGRRVSMHFSTPELHKIFRRL